MLRSAIASIAAAAILPLARASPSSGHSPLLKPPSLDCEPCINRAAYKIKAIYHGERQDPFWQPVEAAALQAADELGVDLAIQMYDHFDPAKMAEDIVKAIMEEPDALIVSIPSPEVAAAVRQVVTAGIPVFGLNSGYKYAQELGIQAFVSQDEYAAGIAAANEMLKVSNNTVGKAIFINHEPGNSGLEERKLGFGDTFFLNTGKNITEVDIDPNDSQEAIGLSNLLEGCSYHFVQFAGLRVNEILDIEYIIQRCPGIRLGTFHSSKNVHDSILSHRISFAVSQQEYLQAVLPVQLAMTYVTTRKLPMAPLSATMISGVYFSGLSIIDIDNSPSEKLQLCADEGFPVCPSGGHSTETPCGCTKRSKYRFQGIFHGLTSDPFWDPIFAAAGQAAKDMGVELVMDRFLPPSDSPRNGETDKVIEEKMVRNIITLCATKFSQIDGLFVSIPSHAVAEAIKVCLENDVPVISINSGAEYSRQLGLLHHVGQPEFEAGFAAGLRMAAEGQVDSAWCINHEPGNQGISERCLGFQAALEDANIAYMGQIEVPRGDDVAIFMSTVETAINDDGGTWKGYGLLLNGLVHVASALALKAHHANVTIGSFDTSSKVNKALDEGFMSFAIDQQPYLQGYMPVSLLTAFVQSKQHLQDEVIKTGPTFHFSSPSEQQLACEANHYQVCPVEHDSVNTVDQDSTNAIDQQPNIPTTESEDYTDSTSIIAGALVTLFVFLVGQQLKLLCTKMADQATRDRLEAAAQSELSRKEKLDSTAQDDSEDEWEDEPV
ncbi:ABC transporter substrate-binding protein [Seminavis robusta]|uniref:ABC transporter substrate-binding protein n=1 Tax=Seminavis robusta TaxID=568900 RepID=A0A9N8EA16_9STRA|nr:ABC transporter substrate-binding protein [Seminavis robusta]|eukprot:Sro661_g183190.1 ABC transporter substrate-binding protein (777) ;mRNA; f:29850-32180